MNRQCKVCQRYYDPAKVRPGVPQGICTRACSIDSKRLKASERASRRQVPPRAPTRLFAATSRQWGDVNGACRVCGEERVDRAHVIPRSIAPNGGDSGEHLIALCRSHHREYDGGHLDLLPYLTVDEQAAAVTAAGGLMAAFRIITGNREAAA